MKDIQQQLTKTKDEVSDKELTAKTILALQSRHAWEHGWSTFFEVSLNGRQADCIAFNIYPSRGFPILGYEIKASRSDWLRELKHCAKADPIIQNCDEWYIVEARQGIVEKNELPPGWGLLSLRKSRLYNKIKSDLGRQGRPSREFVARVIQASYRKDGERFPTSVLWEAEQKGYQKGLKEQQNTHEIRDLREKAKIIDNLRDKGLKLALWEFRDIKVFNSARNLLEEFGEYGIVSDIEKSINRTQEVIEELTNIKESITTLKENSFSSTV